MDIALVGVVLALVSPGTLWIILQVAIGLGLVIFVHELGHFAVAKWCGVKCEKFYLGFDIFGIKLARFQWGETEYGIGILPLGGYVKMLGQDDNPSAAAAERERAMLASDDPNAEPQVDPRSYIAKSVPQRMAIISAGVIMNLIFCFVVASIAYGLGVFYNPADLRGTVPGSPAWKAGLRGGDRVVSIDGIEQPRFDQDLMVRVMLGSSRPITFEIERPGEPQRLTVHVPAERASGESRRTIGVSPAPSTTLAPTDPALPQSAASRANPPLVGGERIVAVNGQPIANYGDIQRTLVQHPNDSLSLTVERPSTPPSVADVVHGRKSADSQQLTIELPPQPIYHLGVVMDMGPISAIQAGSPAAAAGIKPGDELLAIDDQPPGDPLTLAERLRRRAGETVVLRLRRNGSEPLERSVTLREVGWSEFMGGSHPDVSVPALGIAFPVRDRVEQVDPNGPAFQQGEGLRVGDQIVSWEFVPPANDAAAPKSPSLWQRLWSWLRRDSAAKSKAIPIEGKDSANWAQLNDLLQYRYREGLHVVLSTNDGRKIDIEPVASTEFFSDDRGLVFINLFRERKAASLGEALALGARDTWEYVLQVYLVLRALFSGELGLDNLGGPVKIAAGAGASATIGFSRLLMFLAMLSANLAVINFLPIPVLDGGHMVFLIAEAIRGKPVSEAVVMRFTLAGFLLIVLLMITVLGMDIQWLWGR